MLVGSPSPCTAHTRDGMLWVHTEMVISRTIQAIGNKGSRYPRIRCIILVRQWAFLLQIRLSFHPYFAEGGAPCGRPRRENASASRTNLGEPAVHRWLQFLLPNSQHSTCCLHCNGGIQPGENAGSASQRPPVPCIGSGGRVGGSAPCCHAHASSKL